MSLINKKGHYITIEANGDYIVFSSKKDYLIFIDKSKSIDILAKYKELVAKLTPRAEDTYYIPEDCLPYAEFVAIAEEAVRYEANLSNYIKSDRYPVIKKYYPELNVNASIPKILAKGGFNWTFKTKEEAENFAVNNQVFGEAKIEQ